MELMNKVAWPEPGAGARAAGRHGTNDDSRPLGRARDRTGLGAPRHLGGTLVCRELEMVIAIGGCSYGVSGRGTRAEGGHPGKGQGRFKWARA